jgi:hypothetical protein
MLLWNYDAMVENIQIATKGVDDEKGKIVQEVGSCIGNWICCGIIERIRRRG